MMVLEREQCGNRLCLYTEEAGICQAEVGTSPVLEARISPAEAGYPGPCQLFGGRTRDGRYSVPRRCVLRCISPLTIDLE